MKKVNVFFTKSDSIWSKIISLFYKIIFQKETKFTHTGLLFNGKIFEIDLSKKSGFYDRKLNNETLFNLGNINLSEFNYIINKYSDLNYDLGEILRLSINNNSMDKDKNFICSTLVAYILKDLKKLNKYNYETISPDDLYYLIGEKE